MDSFPIVIPLHQRGGKFKDNKELRFALRSIARHFQDECEIALVCRKPPAWVTGIRHIPCDQGLKTAVKAAAEVYPEGFFWTYDDLCVLRDTTAEQMKVTPACRGWSKAQTGWSRALDTIRQRLADAGIKARDYSRPHGPYWFDRSMIEEGFADWPGMAGKFPWESWILSKRGWPCRHGVVKQYYGSFRGAPGQHSWFVNYNDAGFTKELRSWLENQFSEPCRWEINAAAKVARTITSTPSAEPAPERPPSLSATLAKLLDGTRSVRLILNPGNTGDAVIARGTIEVIRRLGLTLDDSADTILLGGGGNLTGTYRGMEKVLNSLPKSGKRILILPSTITRHLPLLQSFDDITVIARENATRKLLKPHGIPVLLAEDAAFEVDYSLWRDAPDTDTKELLLAFRTDSESTGHPAARQAGNRDLSKEFGEGSWTPESASTASTTFISAINAYRTVHTDRLHIAIVAACLGKQVELYPNSYHKNRSVFGASLQHFPNVKLKDPKVFGIGWAKTGTTSLGTALELLGYRHCGQRRDLFLPAIEGDTAALFEAAARYDAFEDWPWLLFYQELDQHFPGSKFILTTRPAEDWIASFSNMRRRYQADPLVIRLRRFLFGEEYPRLSPEIFTARYERHLAEVRAYFKDRPDDLLIVDWSAGDGWENLARFLGVEAPAVPFPHKNRGKYPALR